MKLKKGKYVGCTFSAEQKKARSFWRRASEQECGLRDGLMICDMPNRAECHKKLDKRLDQIERLRNTATELFSDVSESFTIASGTLNL